MNDWESVKELQAFCGRTNLIRIYDERKLSNCLSGLALTV